MVPHLYMHTGGEMSEHTFSIDDPWHYNIRVQIFCASQEEKDYLQGLNLMHGREIEVNVWRDWLAERRAISDTTGKWPKVLPIAYTTYPINLRGF